MSGTICVLSGDLSRYATFMESVARLAQKHPDEDIHAIQGKGIVAGINSSIAAFLDGPGDWWFLMGDDHVFGPDVLTQLLARAVPICAPLNVQRHRPFHPLIYAAAQPGGPPVHQYTWKHLEGMHGLYKLPQRDSCGSAGLLVRREVFAALSTEAWFVDRPGVPYSEDLYFCERVRQVGYDIYIDLDCRLGHSFPATAIPIQSEDGSWLVAIEVNGQRIVYIRY